MIVLPKIKKQKKLKKPRLKSARELKNRKVPSKRDKKKGVIRLDTFLKIF